MTQNDTDTGQTGMRGYINATRRFSRNARLYLLHIFGMDVIHGTWEVVFNLYLLAAGFSIQFVGLRLLVQGIAGSLAAVPAGWLGDRIDRRWGFIIGDGGGAIFAIVQVSSLDESVILIGSAFAAMFSALHRVTEAPFMAENSEPAERIHLFSVGGGVRTIAAMLGALVAGFFPAWLQTVTSLDRLDAFRWATYIGIVWWFASLIPALMMRPYVSAEVAEARLDSPDRPGLLGNIRSPDLIKKFVIVGALLSLGGGFVIRLTNVFLAEDGQASEGEIGTIFALGFLVLAVASFSAPFAAEKLGPLRAIWLSRFAAIPFILLLGFSPQLATPETVVSLAAVAFMLRTALFNMSGPLYDAFTMETLHPNERATFTGLSALVGSALAAGAGFFGASLMDGGNFRLPFLVMATLYAISTYLFMRWFGSKRMATALTAERAPDAKRSS